MKELLTEGRTAMLKTAQEPLATETRASSPPALLGYTYYAPEAYQSRNLNRLLSLRVEVPSPSNLPHRQPRPDKINFDVLRNLIVAAGDLGARSVILTGGEPVLHPQFPDLLTFIDSLDMIPVVFSNVMLVTEELAYFLFAHNASVMANLDVLRPDAENFLPQGRGAITSIQQGLHNLMQAGFTDAADRTQLRLGISFASNNLDIDEIEILWRFCSDHNVFPNMVMLAPMGKVEGERASGIPDAEGTENSQNNFGNNGKAHGCDWLADRPLNGSGCRQYLYSLYVTSEGNVKPCAPMKFDEHAALKVNGIYPYNIWQKSLDEIYDSKLFTHVRQIDRHLEGKCCCCDRLRECIGCRGYAYSAALGKGMNPDEMLGMECQQCFE
jgi:MoaA/NifB/PqqE/SkfB family radical SAM enzyme